MKETPKKRGRLRKADAKSAAERMRAYRKRKRDAGFTSVRRWESADDSLAAIPIIEFLTLAVWRCIAGLRRGSRAIRVCLRKRKPTCRAGALKPIDPKPRYLKEWQEILQKPWPTIAEMMTSMSEDATRLRSSSPFAEILNDKEREQIYAAFRA